MRVYLAGPINGCTDEECNDWRDTMAEKIGQYVSILNPMRRDYRGKEHLPEVQRAIVELDKVDVALCNVFIANCPKPSVGTSMEVKIAWDAGAYVVVVVPPGASVSPWLAYHAHCIADTYELAAKVVLDHVWDICGAPE